MPDSWPIRWHLSALVSAIVLSMAALLAYSIQSTVRGNLAQAGSVAHSLAQIAAVDAQRLVHDSGVLLIGLAQRPEVRALDPANCDYILTALKQLPSQFANLAIADQVGRVVCTALPQTNGKLASVAGSVWFDQVAKANRYIAGHPYIGPVSGKKASVLAYAIQDEGGRFKGAIGLPIDLVNFQPLLNMHNLPAETVVRIVNSSGTIIASSDDPKRWIGVPFPDREMLARINAETRGQAWHLNGAKTAIYGFTPVAGTDWFAVCSISAVAIYGNILKSTAESGGVLLSLTLLCAVLTYYAGRCIVLPMIGIADTAKAVAAGDLSRRAPVAGPREIQSVARQFNTMLDVRLHTEEKYRNLLESASDAIVIVDQDRRIIFANARSERMFGFTSQEMVGHEVEMLIPERAREKHARVSNEYIGSPRPCSTAVDTSVVARRKDGTEFPVEVTLSPLRTSEGLIVSSIIRDLSERKRYEERLVYLAQYDALTGLPNRYLLRDHLEQAIVRAGREGGNAALIQVDIDRFKEINDTLGQYTGDQVLKSLAERLVVAVGQLHTVAHLGGDEFAILVENSGGEAEILSIAENIQHACDQPMLVVDREIFLLVSLGITVYPDDGSDSDALLKNADVALHQAKHDGRNTFRFYAPQMDARANERLNLEHRLHRALPNKELLLHYQPQVNTATGRICGLEALVRLKNPELGMVPPLDFIGIAEETGLIDSFGEWILRTACAQNKTWQEMGLKPVVMAVNISARQFRQKNLAKMVLNVLRQTGLDPKWLELEITESMLMQHPEETEKTLRQITDIGVAIALDDFGTGYSSLAYLKRFPVSHLKIDRSFVRDIHLDPNDAAIVTAVISMAKSLKLGLVAEGVEQKEQLDLLKTLQCDSYQGYYFSKPMPPEKCISLLMKEA